MKDIIFGDVFTFPHEYNFSIGDTELRKAIFKAFNGRCFYSGRELTANDFHIHHVIPKTKGGKDNIFNYVLCSPEINIQLSNNTDEVSIERVLCAIRTVYAKRVFDEVTKNKSTKSKRNRTKNDLLGEKLNNIIEKNNSSLLIYKRFFNLFYSLFESDKASINLDDDGFKITFYKLNDEDIKFLQTNFNQIFLEDLYGISRIIRRIQILSNGNANIFLTDLEHIKLISMEFIPEEFFKINNIFKYLLENSL